MNNIFSGSNKPVKHVGRNGFDLSTFRAFVMRPSVVRPVVAIDTVPDSSFKINVNDLVRTSSLQTAAFVAGKQDLDFFFVPYRQIYSTFDNTVFGRGDVPSSVFNSVDTRQLPNVSLKNLLFNASALAVLSLCFKQAMQYHTSLTLPDASQYFKDMFNWFYQGVTGQSVDFQEQALDFVFRSCFFDNVSILQINSYHGYRDLHPVGFSSLHMLASLGYGDFSQKLYNIMTMCNFFNPSIYQQDDYDTCLVAIATALYEELDSINISVTPLRLYAYQKAWKEYYRDTISDIDSSYPYISSYDSFDSHYYELITAQALAVHQTVSKKDAYLTRSDVRTCLRPRLHQYKKDLNTGLWPSYNFDVSDLTSSKSYPIFSDVKGDTGALAGFVPAAQGSQGSAYAIKYVLAMQKYAESMMRAGNRTKDLLMAEFGVKSEFVNNFYCKHLGSFSGALDINRVSATAETGSYSVGDIAGNMFTSLNGDTIEFTCNDYGVIIGLMSFVPEVLENGFGLSPHILKTQQLDFYHAEFENLGLVPVDKANFDVEKHGQTHGYGARFYEYKQNLDLALDSFVSCPEQDYELAVTVSGIITPETESLNNSGTDSNLVITKSNSQALSDNVKRNYIMPDCMDGIFTTLDDGTNESAHFKVAMDINVTAVLPMSVTGMM